MDIKVHRGLEQIGGSITEISTATSRIFIDMGTNLPGSGVLMSREEQDEYVNSLFSQNIKEHQAVVYTHAHEDHVGMFMSVPTDVDQYIGEGARKLLLAKYKTLLKAPLSDEDTTIAKEKIKRLETFIIWEKPKRPTPFFVGDIKITPFFSCHSIYDSYMLLIEADDKRIWHTGDYRFHGYYGKGTEKMVKAFATNIDTLITEGTNLNTEGECIHEWEVSRRMACMIQAFKYVVVLASSTDIDRLATINKACRTSIKSLYINAAYMKETMRIFTEREAKPSKGLFYFKPKFVTERSFAKMKRDGFVLVTGTGKLDEVKQLIKQLPQSDTLLIYSSWDGYYKIPEQAETNPKYKEFREAFPNVVDIHTSGHADRKTIEKVVSIVKPKEVIVIHKEKDAKL